MHFATALIILAILGSCKLEDVVTTNVTNVAISAKKITYDDGSKEQNSEEKPQRKEEADSHEVSNKRDVESTNYEADLVFEKFFKFPYDVEQREERRPHYHSEEYEEYFEVSEDEDEDEEQSEYREEQSERSEETNESEEQEDEQYEQFKRDNSGTNGDNKMKMSDSSEEMTHTKSTTAKDHKSDSSEAKTSKNENSTVGNDNIAAETGIKA